MNELRSTDLISEESAALVLDRAAKLDANRAGWLDISELREAALEAGISLEAFERALSEVQELQGSRLPYADRSPGDRALEAAEHEGAWPVWARRTSLLGAGFFLGGLAVLLTRLLGLGDVGIVFALLIALQVALASVLKHRRDGDVVDYWIDLGFLWSGLTFMLFLTGPADRVLEVMSGLGGLIGLLGAAVIALARAPQGRLPAIPDQT
jgi:hypothetical protein